MSNKIEEAMDGLTKALKEDPEYAYGWHANIAMACHDSVMRETILDHSVAHKVGNNAATEFMKICFDVETSHGMLLDKSA